MSSKKFDFAEQCYIRNEYVDGYGPWLWIKSDIGAWSGPKNDWETSHRNIILENVKNRRVCIQAGGNQGMYPYLLSNIFEKVYTFEPDELNFHCLVNNCQSPNIFKMQAALGWKPGQVRVERNNMNNTGMHKVSSEGECSVLMLSIDSLNLPVCDFIQLDLEGYEINALRGARNTIRNCKPIIQCEYATDEVKTFLAKLGYGVLTVSLADTFFIPK